MPSQNTIRRVIIARAVADRWLQGEVRPEFRLRVYNSVRVDMRYIPGLLRSFRDGNARVGSLNPISDLGIRQAFDHLELWTSDREGLIALKDWFEKQGCETTGVW